MKDRHYAWTLCLALGISVAVMPAYAQNARSSRDRDTLTGAASRGSLSAQDREAISQGLRDQQLQSVPRNNRDTIFGQ
jgi:hypothetical protein